MWDGIAAEVVEAFAVGTDVLDVDLIRCDVEVVEAEVIVADVSAVSRVDVVELCAAGTGDDEAGLVSFDLHVLHDVVVATEAK